MSDPSRFMVRCKVSQGFFTEELLVMVAGSSAYVSKDNVQLPHDLAAAGETVEGLVAAYLIQENGDQALIELPGQAIVGGARTWVPSADLARSA